VTAAGSLIRMAVSCALSLFLGACAANYPTRTVSYTETKLERPDAQQSDAELLNVRIEVFEKGELPEDPNVRRGLSPDIRNAESYYVPTQIKNAMQRSGHWGQVRVVPSGGRDGEVHISGKILESDGEVLKLEVQVRDATGAPWFTKQYESVIDAAAYSKAEAARMDAFQDMYNQIANDVAIYRKSLKPGDAAEIRQVAELRFGADFAPATYRSFVKKTETPPPVQPDVLQRLWGAINRDQKPAARVPAYTVDRLPSEDDPVVQRVSRIRAREEFLIDTLDQQYDGLAKSISDPYTLWRASRLKEINAIREVDKVQNEEQAKAVAAGVFGVLLGVALASQSNSGGGCYGCTTAGVAVAAGAVAIGVQMATRASEQAASETALRRTALEELGNSLATDVKPTIVEVEGKTVELKGTVEEKFKAWREVLQSLQELETGPATPATS